MTEPIPAPAKRYLARFAIAMTLYVVLLPISIWLFQHAHPSAAAIYVLALAPAAPIVGVIVIVGLYLKEADEFHRATLTQAMLWGIAVTLAVTTIWGFLENFGKAPHKEAFVVFPLFCLSAGLAMPIVMRRYR
jgi:hypothetical protein